MPIVKESDHPELFSVLSGKKCLVVEDSEINQSLITCLLQQAGMTAVVACNGYEAIESIKKDPSFDVIIMDLQMPVMDGLTAARAIRALPGPPAAPILAMTANAFDDNRRACTAAGISDFIVKPVVLNELYATLLRWLEQDTSAQRL